MLFAGCNQDGYIQNINESNNLTGEEIFKGIFFQEGDFVNMVKSISDIKSHETKLSKEMQLEKQLLIEDVISNVNRIEPTFFDNFKDRIKGGDYIEIENAIKNGSDILLKGIIMSPKYGILAREAMELSDSVDFSKFDPSNESDLKMLQEYLQQDDVAFSPVALALFVVVAVAVWEAAIVINVLAAVTFHHTVWGTDFKSMHKESLTKEYLIIDICNAFK